MDSSNSLITAFSLSRLFDEFERLSMIMGPEPLCGYTTSEIIGDKYVSQIRIPDYYYSFCCTRRNVAHRNTTPIFQAMESLVFVYVVIYANYDSKILNTTKS